MCDGRLEVFGHNWVEGQGSGHRIDNTTGEEEDEYHAMGNKIATKNTKKIIASETGKERAYGAYKERVKTLLMMNEYFPFLYT
ncbi:hypothetical protein BYT27DRAFT_7188044 [Phlegmacium glaucopus]|nr:hypothetical protein BYT27DRAFT_7188044 [Phlegmacium glaucopus]